MDDITKLLGQVTEAAAALTRLIVKILDIFGAKPDTGISFGDDEINDLGTAIGDVIKPFQK